MLTVPIYSRFHVGDILKRYLYSSYESILDLDPVTLRRFWFKTSRSNREEVPEPWKQDFLNMLITCGEKLPQFYYSHL